MASKPATWRAEEKGLALFFIDRKSTTWAQAMAAMRLGSILRKACLGLTARTAKATNDLRRKMRRR